MYKEIYDICIPHMTKEEASLVAATLSMMPRERALAMVQAAMLEKVFSGNAQT